MGVVVNGLPLGLDRLSELLGKPKCAPKSPLAYEARYFIYSGGIPRRAVSNRFGVVLSLRRLWTEDIVHGFVLPAHEKVSPFILLIRGGAVFRAMGEVINKWGTRRAEDCIVDAPRGLYTRRQQVERSRKAQRIQERPNMDVAVYARKLINLIFRLFKFRRSRIFGTLLRIKKRRISHN
jgi:hypothetical protein